MATYKVDITSIPSEGQYTITRNNFHNYNANGNMSCNTEYFMMRDYVVESLTSSSGAEFFPLGYNGLPYDLVLKNQRIVIDQYAIRSITAENVTFGPPASNWQATQLIAGSEITLDPESKGINNVAIKIGPNPRFGSCATSPPPNAATSSEVRSICEDINRYDPRIAQKKGRFVESDIISSSSLTAFPNPTTGQLTLRFELEESAPVNITIFDLMGAPVLPVHNQTDMQAGSHEVSVDMSRLAAGMYHVVMEASGKKQTVKVVKSK